MKNLYLPPHIYFCAQGSAVVFLDLRRDRYIRIDGEQAEAFGSLLGARRKQYQYTADGACASWSEALRELVECGLLTADELSGRAIRQPSVECVTDLLVDSGYQSSVRVEARDLRRFLVACTDAWLRLRRQPIETVIGAVQARKNRHWRRGVMDMANTRRLAAAFHRLRFLFPAKYVCLFDSLALINFLAAYEVFPTLVFGVRLDPWGAHCWVQEGELLFNDEAERVVGYVPIMAI